MVQNLDEWFKIWMNGSKSGCTVADHSKTRPFENWAALDNFKSKQVRFLSFRLSNLQVEKELIELLPWSGSSSGTFSSTSALCGGKFNKLYKKLWNWNNFIKQTFNKNHSNAELWTVRLTRIFWIFQIFHFFTFSFWKSVSNI